MDTPKRDEECILRIMMGMKCRKDFECYKSGFKKMGAVKDIGLRDFVECQERRAAGCDFGLGFGEGYFCQCPMRIYAARNIEKHEGGKDAAEIEIKEIKPGGCRRGCKSSGEETNGKNNPESQEIVE